MQVDFKRENISCHETKWSGASTLLVEGDVIVPDAKPDMREILLAEATPAITSQTIMDGKLNVSGSLDVRIVYQPEEAGMPAKSMETQFMFQDTIELPADAVSDVTVLVDTEHISFKLLNSRKLNLKVVIALRTRAYEQKELSFVTDVKEPSNLKVRKKPVTVYQTVADTCRDILVTETLELPATKPDIEEIVRLSVKPMAGDCKFMSGKILLKGSLQVATLYNSQDPDDGILSVEHELFFSEIEEIAGLTENCFCHVTYRVQKLDYSISQDANGDARAITMHLTLRAHIMVSDSQSLYVIDDCYSTVDRTDSKTQTLYLDEVLSEGVSYENIKEIVTIPEGRPKADVVYNLHCKPQIKEVHYEGSTVTLQGQVTVFILYGCTEADDALYSLVETCNFTHVLPVDGLDEHASCEWYVTDQGMSFTLNAASEIELRCSLSFFTRLIRKQPMLVLTDCELHEEESARRGGLVIYFVKCEDSLWSIAKHYRTDEETILRLNALDREELTPGQKLLIPMN